MNEFKRIRVLSCDHLNLARGKYLPVEHAKKGMMNQSLGIYAVDYKREFIDAAGCGVDSGFEDITAVFNIDKIRPGWEADTGVVVADMTSGGKPLPLCGRSALKKSLADWKQLGLDVNLGIELEAYVFQRNNAGEWVPYDTPGAYVYGTGPSNDPEGLMDEIWRIAYELDFPIEAINSEFDWPQFEFTLEYSDALSALDNLFLFKLLSKEVLIKKGYLFSYMPKPLSDRGGSGMHLNISLTDEQGNNVLDDPGQEDGLADMAKRMTAGLVKHHKSLAAIMCPTVNSFKRLRPSNICGHVGNWGYDHRCATTRIPLERGRATRVEHRLADCAANPYVAAAAALQACLLGYRENYEIPDPEPSENFTGSDSTNVVADTLGNALADLQADKALCDAVGDKLIEHFLALKTKEWNDYLDHTTDWELDTYLQFI